LRTLLRTLALLAAVSLIVAVGFVIYDYFQAQGNFPYETYIGSVDVSGLNQSQALEKLRELKASQVFSPLITIEADQLTFVFPPETAGLGIDHEKSVKEAFAATHRNGYLKDLKERFQRGPLRLKPVFTLDEGRLASVIEALAAEINASPRDATIILYEETGGYNIEPENAGKEVRIKDSIELFKSRLAQGERTFPLIIEHSAPRVTEADLRAQPPVYRLSAFTTYYGTHDSPNRIHNIKLIASWLEGTLLMSGESFSLARALGDITPERGFKEAYTIIGGELVPSLGGGACQIATTLYNAVSLADLKIIQRRNHSFYFNIYPLGRDATVYPGQLDFKFENDTGQPILIKAAATNRRLSFRIYGTPNGKTVKFSSPSVEMLAEGRFRPATVKEVLDADNPFKTTVTRSVFDAGGKLLKSETISSYYKLYGEKSNVPIARPEPR